MNAEQTWTAISPWAGGVGGGRPAVAHLAAGVRLCALGDLSECDLGSGVPESRTVAETTADCFESLAQIQLKLVGARRLAPPHLPTHHRPSDSPLI